MLAGHILTIDGGRYRVRVFGAILVVASVLLLYLAVCWQISDLIVDVTSSGSDDAEEIAKTAVALAPSNPRAHWLYGAILKASANDQALEAAAERYEEVVRLTPNHYRAWSDLGRIREQLGELVLAEQAFQQSVESAPDYAIPHWQFGNFYLRRARIDDAVNELKAASLYPSPYRVHVFALAWNVLGRDPALLEQFLDESDDSKASLAYFYGRVDRPEDAVRIWNTIDPERRASFKWRAELIARDLMAHRSYRGALEFYRETGVDPDARLETITNPGFEMTIQGRDQKDLRFDWTLPRVDGKVDASIDTVTVQSGRRSLRFTFRGYAGTELPAIRQAVALIPGRRYRLSFWVRTENLRGASLPLLEVRNSRNDRLIASTPPLPTGTEEWREMHLDFVVSEGQDGIYVTTNREICHDGGNCPLAGTFWLDSFSLST